MRGPYEGLWNVVRFNWPKYLLGIVVVLLTAFAAMITNGDLSMFLAIISVLGVAALVLPLLVSHIIYDRSDLYALRALKDLPSAWQGTLLNINAGFDESSALIRERWRDCTLEVADIYDPAKHTERSIARARGRYPCYPGTRSVTTDLHHYADASVDVVHASLSLHEVRMPDERIRVLSSIRRVLGPEGRLVVTEHLRDLPNFIAFNFGFLHFHSRRTWTDAFARTGFVVERTAKTTAFITTFILRPK